MKITIKIDDKEETFEDIAGFTACLVTLNNLGGKVYVGTKIDKSLSKETIPSLAMITFKAHAKKMQQFAKSDRMKAAFDNLLELL